MEKDISTKLIASKLKVTDNTIRRWSDSLEQEGYIFERNGSRRTYQDADLKCMKQLQKLIKKMSLVEATAEIAKQQLQQRSAEIQADLQGKTGQGKSFFIKQLSLENQTDPPSIPNGTLTLVKGESVVPAVVVDSKNDDHTLRLLQQFDQHVSKLPDHVYWNREQALHSFQKEWLIIYQLLSTYFPGMELPAEGEA
jgi:uncharacterized protein YukE